MTIFLFSGRHFESEKNHKKIDRIVENRQLTFFSKFAQKMSKFTPIHRCLRFFYRLLLKKNFLGVKLRFCCFFKGSKCTKYLSSSVHGGEFLNGLFDFFRILRSTFWKSVSPISLKKPQWFFTETEKLLSNSPSKPTPRYEN